jgi:hypothetical protein
MAGTTRGTMSDTERNVRLCSMQTNMALVVPEFGSSDQSAVSILAVTIMRLSVTQRHGSHDKRRRELRGEGTLNG